MRRVLQWTGAVAVLALLAWAALHVFISPVNPGQQPPAGHPSTACWACHFVSESAELREP